MMEYTTLRALILASPLLAMLIFSSPAIGQRVEVWRTDPRTTHLLEAQPLLSFGSTSNSAITVTVDSTKPHQQMDGFGAAMTGSAAYLMHQLQPDQRLQLMKDLFTKQADGIRLTLVRQTIGASDFSLSSYTYDDQEDSALQNFSVDHNPSSNTPARDGVDVIPMLQEAQGLAPDLKIIGSPWSAPAWMKVQYDAKAKQCTSTPHSSLNEGCLNPARYDTYADYLVKYVQAYEGKGLLIYAMTPQNEPLHSTPDYPSMWMDPVRQIGFLMRLGPAFEQAGLATKIIAYDHNWSVCETQHCKDEDEYEDVGDYPKGQYALDVLNGLKNQGACRFVAGFAFHGYRGAVSAQSKVHEAIENTGAGSPCRNMGIWFTEITASSDSESNSNRSEDAKAGDFNWAMTNIIIGATRNWAKGILYWNLVLDQNHGPYHGDCSKCLGLVTLDTGTDRWTPEVEYYALGHLSKFVDPGAWRIESDDIPSLPNVAFKNLDGSIVVVAFSPSTEQTFEIVAGGKGFTYTLPAGSAVTFKWPSARLPAPTNLRLSH
jgi:glucosylceramidase